MAHANVLEFRTPDKRPRVGTRQSFSRRVAGDRIASQFKAELRELKAGLNLPPAELQLVKDATKEDRPTSVPQLFAATAIAAQHASPRKIRKFTQALGHFLMDLSAHGAAPCLRLAGRDETVAESGANPAQYVANYPGASRAEKEAALRASENHITALEAYCDALRADIAMMPDGAA